MSHSVSFPEGKTIAVLSSWRGGSQFDTRLVEVLDKFGWQGTFYLEPTGELSWEELGSIPASGHNIGLAAADSNDVAQQRSSLESLAGGASVNSLLWSDEPAGVAVESARAAGFRTGVTLEQRAIRASEIVDWLRFPVSAPATHGWDELNEMWDALLPAGDGILHLWGDAAEYADDEDAWAALECNLAWFCGHPHVWYTTLSEMEASR